MENTLPILVANAPEALIELCGVNLLERLLRILQRLGFRSAIVFSTTPGIVGAELAKRSWARDQINAHVVSDPIGPLTSQLVLEHSPSDRFLIVPASIYCDARLLAALCAKDSSAALVDSNPPEFAQPLIRNPCGPAFVTRDFLSALSPAAVFFEELKYKTDNRQIDIVDAAEEDDYIVRMRRRVRPLCFSAPPEQSRRVAERVILTLGGFVIGCSATAAFVGGRVGLGILAALIFGIVDGLDGKLSRVKIETTERGEWEHHLDYLIENSWWLAIAFHLWRSGQFPNVFYFLALLIASHLLAEFAKRRVKIAKGRLLDDVAPFDRTFRLIAARRNVYVWVLGCGFLLGAFPQSYAIICGWAAVSAAVHLTRSVWICNALRRRVVDSRA